MKSVGNGVYPIGPIKLATIFVLRETSGSDDSGIAGESVSRAIQLIPG